MYHLNRHTVECLLLVFLFVGPTTALADSVFMIEDPPVDFDVIDAEPFDGFGDNGPFDTFNIVLLGTLGEARDRLTPSTSCFSGPSARPGR
jgi:hypothetical protein